MSSLLETAQTKAFSPSGLVDKFYNLSTLPRKCVYSIFLNFFGSSLSAVYYFLAIYFVDVMGMNISSAGILVSAHGIGSIFGGYLGGYLSDKISPRFVTSFGLLGQALSLICLANIQSPLFISVDLFLLGITNYCFITSNYTTALNSCILSEKTRLRAINMLNITSNLGIGIASLLLGSLATFGYTNIFYASGTMLFCLALFTLFKEHKNNTLLRNNKSNIDTKNHVEYRRWNAGAHLAFVCLFFTGMVVSQLSSTYAIYLTKSFPQLGTHAFSLFFTLNTILIVLFQNVLVTRFSSANKYTTIGIGSFLIGSSMFLLSFSHSIIFMILVCCIYSAGEMIFFSMIQLFFYETSDSKHKGRGLGAYRMIYASSKFAGPAIGGSIYHHLGSTMLWNICGFIGIAFLILFNLFKRLA